MAGGQGPPLRTVGAAASAESRLFPGFTVYTRHNKQIALARVQATHSKTQVCVHVPDFFPPNKSKSYFGHLFSETHRKKLVSLSHRGGTVIIREAVQQ